MLKERTLFGKVDLVQTAIIRLKQFEQAACAMHPDGYWAAFSGGKDSIVMLDLMKKAGVQYTAHFNLTTVDPPELLRFVRCYYPDVTRERPEISMFQLIEKKMMPPTRVVRYCCAYLKERGGSGRMVTTGVRWAESNRRSKRRVIESCYRDSRKIYLNPIIDWSDDDVWQYIRENRLPYCSLYDEGFRRIGCIGCPMTGQKQRQREFVRWPRFERAYRRAFAKAAACRKVQGRNYEANYLRWDDGEAMFRWWMQDKAPDRRCCSRCVIRIRGVNR